MQDESRHQTEDVDLHAHWAALEAQHSARTMRLVIIVGVLMAVIVIFWGFTVSDTVRSLSHVTQPLVNARDSFTQGLNSYQKELDAYGTASVSSTVATVSSTDQTAQFVDALKAHAADVVPTSSSTSR